MLVVTGDRDAIQLVNDDVTVLYPRKGVSDLTRFTPDEVMSKYGLTPTQYPDYAALRGDPSDNLPGIPGVGEKTAAKWIREYGDLNTLVDRVDEVRGKVGEALRANLSSVLLNRQLTEMVRDVKLPYTPEQLQHAGWNREKIHQLFDDLEFRVLRDRLFETLVSAEPEADEGFEISGGAVPAGEVGEWLDRHASTGLRHGISIDGRGTPYGGDVHALAIAASGGEGGYVDVTTLTPEDEQALGAWFADAGQPKAVHEAKFAMHALRGRGWTLDGLSSDTALAAYLVRPGQRSFNLDDLSLRYLRRELRVDKPEHAQLSLLDDEDAVDTERAETEMLRAQAVLDLAAAFDEELSGIESTPLLAEMELPLLTVLAELEEAGIAVDLDHLHELQSRLRGAGVGGRRGGLRRDRQARSTSARPSSCRWCCSTSSSMPKTKRTKTGYTTDADALQSLFEQTEHPFLDAPAARTATSTRLQDDRRRAAASPSATTAASTPRSTRRSPRPGGCPRTEPNLQNIPIRTDEGRRIREAFVVGAGLRRC